MRFLVPVVRSLAMTEPALCRSWTEAAVKSLPAECHVDGSALLGGLFGPEAASADERVWYDIIDTYSSACRRKRVVS